MSFHWSIHQLTEYLAAVSGHQDEDSTALVAVERAAEALDAEVGVVVVNGAVRGHFGFAGCPPVEFVHATSSTETLTLPPLGILHVTTAVLGRGIEDALIIARQDDPFDAEERQMLQGMAHVLGLTLRNLRIMEQLQDRRRLLETVLDIQRAISIRRPLDAVLDAVTGGASTLLGGAGVALVLIDPLDRERPILASAHRYDDTGAGHPLVLASAAKSIWTDEVITQHDAAQESLVLAVPVHVDGTTAGSLVVQLAEDASPERLGLVTAFAQQVGIALTDARTADAMRQAYHDPLTGLPNRRLLLDRLQHALGRSRLRAEELTVLFVDLDRFKAVNDSLGHQVGDALLTAVAERIQGCIRPSDTAARLGGDEFAVVLEDTSVEEARLVAERIVAALTAPFQIVGHVVSISASIGAAPNPPFQSSSQELLSNADVAMYQAKKGGGGRVIQFEVEMQTQVRERLRLQTDLRRALSRGQLSLHYQPLIRLADGVPVAMEALLRWHHPDRGWIPPSAFIPIAEEAGLIAEIGRWVLAEGVDRIIEWRALVPGLTLDVNVSARQVVDPRFVVEVAETLRMSGLPATALKLELTETVLVSDPVAARKHLLQLEELGVQISIDDFGTGYSSLSCLRQFPVDEVKIDRSLTAAMCRTAEDLAVVRAVVDLARGLHLTSVAEGVEDAEQLARLRALGCDQAQGYHLSRPLSADAARDYLAAMAKRGAVRTGR